VKDEKKIKVKIISNFYTRTINGMVFEAKTDGNDFTIDGYQLSEASADNFLCDDFEYFFDADSVEEQS